MDHKQLDKIIDDFVVSNEHARAKEMLGREYETAKKTGDRQHLDFLLDRLVFVCSTSDPPDITSGRQFCAERETNLPNAFNALQTALFEHSSLGSYVNAVEKLERAKVRAQQEEDYRTAYSVLGHLGRALLEIGQDRRAASVLSEIEQMFLDGKPFVIGDETVFLESAHDKGFEPEAVRRIATALAPHCRDSEYKRRLEALAR